MDVSVDQLQRAVEGQHGGKAKLAYVSRRPASGRHPFAVGRGAGSHRGGAAQVREKRWWGVAIAFLVGSALGGAFTYVIVIHFSTL
jgi:hypothetical protein